MRHSLTSVKLFSPSICLSFSSHRPPLPPHHRQLASRLLAQSCNRASDIQPFAGLRSRRKEELFVCARRGLFAELESIREESNLSGPVEYISPLQIVLYPDPRLRAKNRRINVFDDKLQKLVKEMFDVMYRTDGVGLSAPQVGVNVQLMVFNPEGERGKGEEIVLVNPKIYKYSKTRDVFREGCLSFPLLEADVERPSSVKIEAQNIKGKKFSISLKDFPGRIFQHEYDHLQGILYFERMTPDALRTIQAGLEKLENDFEERTGLPASERIKLQLIDKNKD